MSEPVGQIYCPACDQSIDGIFLYEKNGIAVKKCPLCGLGMSDQKWFDPECYYDSSYFDGSRADGYSNYVETRDVLNIQFRQELDVLERFGVSKGELLELGCAYGFFLELAQTRYQVYGVEICGNAVLSCHARGLTSVQQGTISRKSLEFCPEVDVVVLLDVIEHLPDPVVALVEACKKMSPGGLLLLTTGDFASLVARLMGRQWRLMTPPQHHWYFTPKSFHLIAARLGLEVVDLAHPHKIVPLGLIIYQICRYLSINPRLPKWMHRLGLPVNLFDAMRVVMKKPTK